VSLWNQMQIACFQNTMSQSKHSHSKKEEEENTKARLKPIKANMKSCSSLSDIWDIWCNVRPRSLE
jgi:hypothetical protein